MNQRKFTLKELSQAVGHLRSIHTLPLHCEVCERNKPWEVVVVTSTFIPVAVCLLCATSLVASSLKRHKEQITDIVSYGNGVIPKRNADNTKRAKVRKAVKV